jgi:peptidoglycan/xylan/chitin deacetylase (PgdA/CDA1 family)
MSLPIALLPVKHAASKVLHRYADFRVGATEAERHCHRSTDSILLTFDDYGNASQVAAILQILKDKNVRAMFFLQGNWAAAEPALVGQIRDAGHIIGNHTYSHKVLRGQPEKVIREEITGSMPGPWFRPPQGRYDKHVRRIAADMGYSICYWTIDSRDWTGASVNEMRHTILSELHPGAVVLFHIHGKHTAELLPELIDDIRDRGFTLTDSSEPDWSPR